MFYFSTTARRVTSPTWGPPLPCKQALTYGKHTHATPENPRVAEEVDYLQFLVVLNFPFVFQYTPMLAYFNTDAIEIYWKNIP